MFCSTDPHRTCGNNSYENDGITEDCCGYKVQVKQPLECCEYKFRVDEQLVESAVFRKPDYEDE